MGVPAPVPCPTPAPRQRFASLPRFVEMLVVADESMARFHGAGLRPYLLTVLAAAARSFRHGSLGNAVELRVTRLEVLGPGTPGPPATTNAAQMLRNFCRWQRDLNVPDEDSPLHFDTAILFTRQVGNGDRLRGDGWGVAGFLGAPPKVFGCWQGARGLSWGVWVLGVGPLGFWGVGWVLGVLGCWLGPWGVRGILGGRGVPRAHPREFRCRAGSLGCPPRFLGAGWVLGMLFGYLGAGRAPEPHP